MQIVTYRPRNPNASEKLSFGTPEGNLELPLDTPVMAEDSVIEYLENNVEEFAICLKREVITLKEVEQESPGSNVQAFSKENPITGESEEGIESQSTGEVIVPKSSTTKTVTTTPKK